MATAAKDLQVKITTLITDKQAIITDIEAKNWSEITITDLARSTPPLIVAPRVSLGPRQGYIVGGSMRLNAPGGTDRQSIVQFDDGKIEFIETSKLTGV